MASARVTRAVGLTLTADHDRSSEAPVEQLPVTDSRLLPDHRTLMLRDLDAALAIMADDWKLGQGWLRDRQLQVRGFSDYWLMHMWHTYRCR